MKCKAKRNSNTFKINDIFDYTKDAEKDDMLGGLYRVFINNKKILYFESDFKYFFEIIKK